MYAGSARQAAAAAAVDVPAAACFRPLPANAALVTACRLLLLLQVMRGKIRGRQYVNWQELVRDFELICNNAMKYNQKRSRVYKQVSERASA